MNLEQHGAGPRTFLGIHGWAGNHRTFRRLLAHQPADTTFFTCDLPGYGDTPRTAPIDRAAVTTAIVEAMERIADPHLTLVGNCGGALLALEALRLTSGPDHRAVLIDPFAYPPLYFRIFTWGALGRFAYLTTFANPLGRGLTNGALVRKRSGATNLTRAFQSIDHETALDYIRLYCGFAHAARFAGVPNPVDIVYGARTFAAIRRSLPLWRQTLPNVRCLELRDAGHEPIREATESLAAIIFDASAPAGDAPC